MTMIEVPAPDGEIKAVWETPEGPGPWPAVVLLHDAVGLTADLRRNARMLADHGYLVIAPDLFSRGPRCIPGVFRDLLFTGAGRAVRDILAALRRIRDDSSCTGRVAVAGFCMGGGFALLTAPRGFDAAAPFYPTSRGDYAEMLRGSCPIVASYGRLDPINIGRAHRLERVLDDYGVAHDVKTYSGVTHAFANRLPTEPVLRVAGLGYDEKATEDAWRRVFAFFDAHLKSPSPH
ncbi:dienelactone hydrolase family protein [Nocardia fusca]|uniref:dienelactone hydrolase family protein n=1 Tax=Nocardia fusca TaxID=941183 RepID=UPI0007A75BD6|nr:dienelactone hydrolase family protein [Nocardia fusca]